MIIGITVGQFDKKQHNQEACQFPGLKVIDAKINS
jgi:hypothetical protein